MGNSGPWAPSYSPATPRSLRRLGPAVAATPPLFNDSDVEAAGVDIREFPGTEIPEEQKQNSALKCRKRMVTVASRTTSRDYGKHKPIQRFHLDQVPFAIDCNPTRTFVHYELSNQSLISGIPAGKKRLGTAQVAVHADPDKAQPK